jgi:hypothetical protein
MDRLYAFVEQCCKDYRIDASHGLQHAQGCVQWVERLLVDETDVSEDERRMAIYSAALHDMCDRKYVDPVEASERIGAWLRNEGWSDEMADALLGIVNTMSYSKLKAGGGVFPNHGRWQRAYHLARHADLLDGYLVGRCYLYTKHIQPDIGEEECWTTVERLFQDRVFRYVTDGWISLPLAVVYASHMEERARWAFLERVCDY